MNLLEPFGQFDTRNLNGNAGSHIVTFSVVYPDSTGTYSHRWMSILCPTRRTRLMLVLFTAGIYIQTTHPGCHKVHTPCLHVQASSIIIKANGNHMGRFLSIYSCYDQCNRSKVIIYSQFCLKGLFFIKGSYQIDSNMNTIIKISIGKSNRNYKISLKEKLKSITMRILWGSQGISQWW